MIHVCPDHKVHNDACEECRAIQQFAQQEQTFRTTLYKAIVALRSKGR